ncbi:MAG: hypothetical protein NZ959_06155 [Armatimonadetes bacterium]|nr:hypothetical protein [Armatimonadota bacterium]MDW8121626.1 hypothetical protein [Armatimonadota bacterium]
MKSSRGLIAVVVIVVLLVIAAGWWLFYGRQPQMPASPEEATFIPPSGMAGPNPAKIQEMQQRMRSQQPSGQ